ncbi:H-NS histone family protein [Roseicella aerolata]|uniref:H-NS histone family protein n=1 Tax=Roseicella aerolata TaxID=2883479 RepID=A0A9X1II85_9PROT|nr:H-NS histone family protein [Roseicella aerolata]MCB4825351.1 H-NS histone family protein [Roseicella aerolata]
MPTAKAAPKPRTRETEAEADDAVSLQQILGGLDSLSVGELRQIATAAEAKIRDKSEGEKRALKEEMERRAADLGISIRELFDEPGQPARRGRGKAARKPEGSGVAPKYKGPDGELWSGRGRMPKWLQVAQAEGKSKDDFLIRG